MFVKIKMRPFDDDIKMFHLSRIDVTPGITILVGCNGAGKTTMLHFIRDHCKQNKIPFIEFDNYRHGGKETKERLMWENNGDPTVLAELWDKSEGETIQYNLLDLAKKIGSFMRCKEDNNIRAILIDGIDSGYSIDNIVELKDFLHNVVLKDAKKLDLECYIVMTANSYEMITDEQCIDVISCKKFKFDSYQWYKDFILESRKNKEDRYKRKYTKNGQRITDD